MSDAYPAGVCASSISRPHGRSVGLPNSSWLNQLPHRPIACASGIAGAAHVSSSAGGDPAPLALPDADEHAGEEAARDTEPALPEFRDRFEVVGEPIPVRDDVVEPGPDDAGGDGPDADRTGVIGRADALGHELAAEQPDRGEHTDRDHQPVRVQRERPDRDRVLRWTGDRRQQGHRAHAATFRTNDTDSATNWSRSWSRVATW